MFVFTDKRLIFVNRQGMTGRKIEYQSTPYRNITRFSIETAGTFDLDVELKICLPAIWRQFRFSSAKN